MRKLFDYLSLAIARIFSPNEEEVPEIGVQPLKDEPNSQPHA